jgi:hypothetical protein
MFLQEKCMEENSSKMGNRTASYEDTLCTEFFCHKIASMTGFYESSIEHSSFTKYGEFIYQLCSYHFL